MTALSIMQPVPPDRIAGGKVIFKGQDMLKMSSDQVRAMCDNKISMIFPEPMTSLNPVFAIGEQIAEAIRLRTGVGKKQAHEHVMELRKQMEIPDSEDGSGPILIRARRHEARVIFIRGIRVIVLLQGLQKARKKRSCGYWCNSSFCCRL